MINERLTDEKLVELKQRASRAALDETWQQEAASPNEVRMLVEEIQRSRERHDVKCISRTDSENNLYCDCKLLAILEGAKIAERSLTIDFHAAIAERDEIRNWYDDLVEKLDHLIPDGDEATYSNPEGDNGSIIIDVFTAYKRERDEALARLNELESVITNELAEEGRKLASEREDLIASGGDPHELVVPIAPMSHSITELIEQWRCSNDSYPAKTKDVAEWRANNFGGVVQHRYISEWKDVNNNEQS